MKEQNSPYFKSIWSMRMSVHIGVSVLLQVLWEAANAPPPPTMAEQAADAVFGAGTLLWFRKNTFGTAATVLEASLPSFMGPVLPETPAGSVHAPWALGFVFTLVTWQVLLWTTVALFRTIEYLAARRCTTTLQLMGVRGKLRLPQGHVEPEFRSKLPTCVRNMAGLMVAVVAGYVGLTWFSPDWFYHETWPDASTCGNFWMCRYMYTMATTTKLILTTDIFFYWGHRAMHTFPSMKAYHAVHHQSFASDALGGYYMGAVDFFLEHSSIFWAWAIWREVGAAWAVSVCVGAWNLLASHSAWDCAWAGDPREHFWHHNGKLAGRESNLGIFFDHVCGTHMDPPASLVYDPYGINDNGRAGDKAAGESELQQYAQTQTFGRHGVQVRAVSARIAEVQTVGLVVCCLSEVRLDDPLNELKLSVDEGVSRAVPTKMAGASTRRLFRFVRGRAQPVVAGLKEASVAAETATGVLSANGVELIIHARHPKWPSDLATVPAVMKRIAKMWIAVLDQAAAAGLASLSIVVNAGAGHPQQAAAEAGAVVSAIAHWLRTNATVRTIDLVVPRHLVGNGGVVLLQQAMDKLR